LDRRQLGSQSDSLRAQPLHAASYLRALECRNTLDRASVGATVMMVPHLYSEYQMQCSARYQARSAIYRKAQAIDSARILESCLVFCGKNWISVGAQNLSSFAIRQASASSREKGPITNASIIQALNHSAIHRQEARHHEDILLLDPDHGPGPVAPP
jgi:hypothetical protein